jgi:hypothetical protein
MIEFKGSHFEREVILWGMRCAKGDRDRAGMGRWLRGRRLGSRFANASALNVSVGTVSNKTGVHKIKPDKRAVPRAD